MDYRCPYCEKPMGRKLMIYKPFPGERRILPNQAMPVCPYCKKELETNFHPKEKLMPLIGIGPAFILLAAHLKNNSLFIVGTVFLGISLIGLLYIEFKYFKKWPRFKKRENHAL
jgi:glutaredoxin